MNNELTAGISGDERLDEVNCDIRIIQKKDGLTFGTDAYLLAAYIDAQPKASAYDLGAGTGIISLLCAGYRKAKHIAAIELQPQFADIARRNVILNSMTASIDVAECDVRTFITPSMKGTADVVFTNPPYMRVASGKHNDSGILTAARRELNGTVADFCRAAGNLLRTGGSFYCVFLPERLPELSAAMTECGIEPKRLTLVYPDAASKPSLVLVKGKRGASASLDITRPLFMYSGGRDKYTRDMQKIYDTCSFEHLF